MVYNAEIIHSGSTIATSVTGKPHETVETVAIVWFTSPCSNDMSKGVQIGLGCKRVEQNIFSKRIYIVNCNGINRT